jgi:MscS family membrane protein
LGCWAAQAFGRESNVGLLERFSEKGIEFAFPTQTLYIARDAVRPLSVDVSNGA